MVEGTVNKSKKIPCKFFAFVPFHNERKSETETLECEKTTEKKSYIEPENEVTPGDCVLVDVEISNPIPPRIIKVDNIVKYDVSKFTVSGAYFDQDFFALLYSGFIDVSTPGSVRFSGTFLSPQIIPDLTLMGSLKLISSNNAPLGLSMIFADTSTKFYDSTWSSSDIMLGRDFIRIMPNDISPPLINPDYLVHTDTSIVGIKGSITDNYGFISNYLQAGLFMDDSICLGQVYVDSNGRFEILDHYLAYTHLKLIAIDGVGNESSYKFDYVLPVELISFSSFVKKNDVIISWTTSQELNNSGFNIERSIGNNEWLKAGFIRGNGSTTEPHDYSFTDKNLKSGKYNYRLKQLDFNGNFEYFNLSGEVVIGISKELSLSQNYPNPFNPLTNISYAIPITDYVSLKIFDMSGKEVAVLVNQKKEAGYYSAVFDGTGLPSGIYFYRLKAGDAVFTRKMLLIK